MTKKTSVVTKIYRKVVGRPGPGRPIGSGGRSRPSRRLGRPQGSRDRRPRKPRSDRGISRGSQGRPSRATGKITMRPRLRCPVCGMLCFKNLNRNHKLQSFKVYYEGRGQIRVVETTPKGNSLLVYWIKHLLKILKRLGWTPDTVIFDSPTVPRSKNHSRSSNRCPTTPDTMEVF